MKVFDFTDGRKGRLLGQAPRAAALHGFLVRKGDKIYRVELTSQGKHDGEWTWHSGAEYNGRDGNGRCTGEQFSITPEQFGVEAICFCTGQWRTGEDAGKWVWSVVGTTDWNRDACKRGILKATFSHDAIPDTAYLEE